MIKAVITDFSRVLLFLRNGQYQGSLNSLNNKLLASDPSYDFWEYFTLNQELLDYYRSLNLPVYIFTSETIQDHPAVKEKLEAVFRGVFSAKRLGVHKTDPQAYVLIAQKLDLRPDEIMYIDDKKDYAASAQAAGCKTIHYQSNNDVIGKVA